MGWLTHPNADRGEPPGSAPPPALQIHADAARAIASSSAVSVADTALCNELHCVTFETLKKMRLSGVCELSRELFCGMECNDPVLSSLIPHMPDYMTRERAKWINHHVLEINAARLQIQPHSQLKGTLFKTVEQEGSTQ